jgi:hypothetical protein
MICIHVSICDAAPIIIHPPTHPPPTDHKIHKIHLSPTHPPSQRPRHLKVSTFTGLVFAPLLQAESTSGGPLPKALWACRNYFGDTAAPFPKHGAVCCCPSQPWRRRHTHRPLILPPCTRAHAGFIPLCTPAVVRLPPPPWVVPAATERGRGCTWVPAPTPTRCPPALPPMARQARQGRHIFSGSRSSRGPARCQC